MKASFQHLGFEQSEGSFLCYQVSAEQFGFHWHYHPECEISFVVNGYGTRLIGDNVSTFEKGDLLFLGSNLPHTLISDEIFNRSQESMEVVVIQFHPGLFHTRTEEIEELSSISKLIRDGSRGLHFELSEVPDSITDLIIEMIDMNGFERYLSLLRLLHELSQVPYRPLASMLYEPNLSTSTEKRIVKVCAFIHENFKNDVSVVRLAELANMNESAFCRFFKKITGMTATSYINDLRLGMACRLLRNDETQINEVAYSSGFSTIPYFNRYFKKMKNCSPSQYRKRYRRA